MFLLMIIPCTKCSQSGVVSFFSFLPPAKRIGRTSSWDDVCEAASSPVARVACLHFSRFSIVPFSKPWESLWTECVVISKLHSRFISLSQIFASQDGVILVVTVTSQVVHALHG